MSPLPIELCLDRRPRIHRRAPDCACYLAAGHAGDATVNLLEALEASLGKEV